MIKNSTISLKRILFITVLVALYSVFFSFVAFGQDKGKKSEDTPLVAGPANVWSAVAGGMFGDKAADWNLDFVDIMSNANAGQNLYLMIYQKVNVTPEKDAFKETAQAFGLTLAEAYAVERGSPTPFLNQEFGTRAPATQAQALKRVGQFINALNKRRAELQFEADLVTEHSPTEIFYNGELHDSGFDLVYDLQIIEQILFNETEKIQLGGEYTGGLPPKPLIDHDPNVDLSPKKGIGQKDPGPSTDGVDTDPNTPDLDDVLADANKDSSDATNASSKKDNEKIGSAALTINGDLSDPAHCLVDDELASALASAAGNVIPPNLGNVLSAADLNAYADGDGDTSGEADAGTAGDGENDEGDTAEEEKSPEEAFAEAEEAYNDLALSDVLPNLQEHEDQSWCFEAFCLEVNFKYKTASAYVPGETCIACEIEEINDHLWDTIKNNLSSNKAPGNLFENAKCKKSLVFHPNINVIWLQNPIPFPANTDLIQSKSIPDRWNEFKKLYKPGWPGNDHEKREDSPADSDDVKKAEELAADRDPLQKATEEAVNYAPGAKTQAELQAQIQNIVRDEVEKINREVDKFKSGGESADFGEFYRLLETEVDTMDTYFKIYKDAFDEIANKTCPQIKDKPDAS